MANKRIDQFPAADNVNNGDFIHISQGGIDKRISADVLIEKLNGGNPFNITVLEESSNARTLSLGDRNAYIQFLNATSTTATVPNSSDVPWKLGDTVILRKDGAGDITVEGAVGVTVNGSSSGLELVEVGQAGQLIYTGSNTWDFMTGGNSTGGLPSVYSYSTSELEDITSAANTVIKFEAKAAWNTTTKTPVWATGAGDSATWVNGVGTVVHIPV